MGYRRFLKKTQTETEGYPGTFRTKHVFVTIRVSSGILVGTGWNRYIHGVAGLPILRGRCKVAPYAGVSLVAAKSSPKRRYVPLVDNTSSSHCAFSARSPNDSRAEHSWFDPR